MRAFNFVTLDEYANDIFGDDVTIHLVDNVVDLPSQHRKFTTNLWEGWICPDFTAYMSGLGYQYQHTRAQLSGTWCLSWYTDTDLRLCVFNQSGIRISLKSANVPCE